MTDLRKEARGRECQIRLISVCNRDSETSVLAHLRLSGITGIGQKAPDLLATIACSECHRISEVMKDDDQVQRAFLEGVMRTQYLWIKEGFIEA